VETTPAILLRKTKLTETSLIVTWFTAAQGKVKTVAKGARQPKSRFAGVLDLFFDCEIQYARSRRSELHQLREVAIRNPHEALRLDYPRVALASYFVELIELVTESDHPAPELYDLLLRAFGFLNAQPASLRALLHFESELTRLLGIQGQEGVTPAVAIGRTYHRIPSTRPGLLKTLKPPSA
jgi:DNA repair protein RecO (recombination protein O)